MNTEQLQQARVVKATPDKTVEEVVKDTLCYNLSISQDDVQMEKKIIEDLGADSLDSIEIVVHLEEEIGFTIEDGLDDDVIRNGTTVADLIIKVADVIKENVEVEGDNLASLKHDTISALRIHLHDCDVSPGQIIKRAMPQEYEQRAWIPQTMGDQIWALFDFKTRDAREKWEASLPQEIKGWLDRELIEHALPYGWQIRDINGFQVGPGVPKPMQACEPSVK